MLEILPLLIAGLALFLYGINRLSNAMRSVFSERAKESISRYTRNIYLSILIGVIVTILLGSSSAVIIITIIFINAGTLNFKQAIGIVMGANIGTTFSSQLIALDIGYFAVFPMSIGLIILIFFKQQYLRKIGGILFYFGALFFGLFLMEQSVYPLRESEVFEQWLTKIEDNPLQGSLVGGLITLIIQSSSATVGIVIVLGKQQLITLAGGIAIMLGAELGTCSDVLLATIKGSRQAIKTGLFHFVFNLVTIIAGLIFFSSFVRFIEWLSVGQEIDNQIALAHISFSVIGVLVFLPFVSIFEKILNRLLPEKSI